jgi:hypothetical protein
MRALFGVPGVSVEQMIDWTAHWIRSGSYTYGKPAHFEVRDDPQLGLLGPVLELAAEETRRRDVVKVCGATRQAVHEAELANSLGLDAALLSLGSLPYASNQELIDHTRTAATVIPIIGFYLQPSVGGRVLNYDFWARFVNVENVVAIKSRHSIGTRHLM